MSGKIDFYLKKITSILDKLWTESCLQVISLFVYYVSLCKWNLWQVSFIKNLFIDPFTILNNWFLPFYDSQRLKINKL